MWRCKMKSVYPKTAQAKTTHGKAAPSSDSKRKQRLTMAGALLLLLLGTWHLWPNSQLAMVRQMQQDLFSTPRDALSPEERKEKIDALRTEQEKLSPEERKQLRQDMGKQFQKKMNAEAVKYLAMSAAERQIVVDERI